MRLSIVGVVAISPLLLSGCTGKDGERAYSQPAIASIHTDLGTASCRKEIDRDDPNETPYLVCPGVAGYTLVVRRVDAGRQSIDVVDSAQRAFPLKYQEYVTRSMSSLDDKAEWRVATTDSKQVPIALIVRLHAREDDRNPGKVTRSYVAIAKITSSEACVTDTFPAGALPEAAMRSAADSAPERPCAPPQPPMTLDGTVIR